MELVKFLQAMYISYDVNLYNAKDDVNAKVQSSNLNEELGQVEYIFSDKTGTLTQNIMDFKCMSIGNYEYGFYNQGDNKPQDLEITNVNFKDDLFEMHKKDPNHPNYLQIRNYLTHLSVCHTVIVS